MIASKWTAEAERLGLVSAGCEWTWDDTNGEWWAECRDARYDGSYEYWTVSEQEVSLKSGSFYARSDIDVDTVAVMAALAACVDAFNVEYNERSNG